MSRGSGTSLAVAACTFGAFGVIVGALLDVATWFQGTLTANVAADLALAPVGLLIAFLGVLITVRRAGNRIGSLFSTVAFFTGLVELSDAYASRALVAAPGTLPGGLAAGWLANWVWVPVVFGLLACLPLIFPNGMLLTRRWRWVWRLVIAHMALLSVGLALAPSDLNDYRVANPLGIETPGRLFSLMAFAGFVLILPSVALAAAAIFLRFRRSQGLERLQVKWLAMGAVVAAVTFAVSLALTYAGFEVIWNVTIPIAISSVVLASGLAVLRYRLYDIDRIIGRTLTYGILTLILGAMYVGLVLAAQAVFSTLAGGSNLAIAVSTLFVAAIFLPVRARVQAFVDRRFYRRRYDASRTLETFGSRLREQIELDALSEDLLTAVGETMQPTSASLWLNDSQRHPKPVTIP